MPDGGHTADRRRRARSATEAELTRQPTTASAWTRRRGRASSSRSSRRSERGHRPRPLDRRRHRRAERRHHHRRERAGDRQHLHDLASRASTSRRRPKLPLAQTADSSCRAGSCSPTTRISSACVTAELMRRSGYDVVCAASGEEALLLLDDSFDALVTDVAMTGMNGQDACPTACAIRIPVDARPLHLRLSGRGADRPADGRRRRRGPDEAVHPGASSRRGSSSSGAARRRSPRRNALRMPPSLRSVSLVIRVAA